LIIFKHNGVAGGMQLKAGSAPISRPWEGSGRRRYTNTLGSN